MARWRWRRCSSCRPCAPPRRRCAGGGSCSPGQGADVLLVALAAVGWWQLRDQPAGSGSPIDAVRVLAPALLLIAGSALALRLVWPALRVVERLARRARGLLVPLAAFEAARRPQAVAAGLLVGLGCAAATYGIGFDATWQRSQQDQADLAVGTDLALALTAPPAVGQGPAVGTATGGEVSPATDRGIAVGQWLGGAGDPPRLVAVDATRADALLRGRLNDGRSWSAVGAALAPPSRVAGIAVPAGAALSLTGNATGTTPLTTTPRLLLQDPTGLRTPCTGPPIPLDGKPHPLPDCASGDGLRLVAVSLPFEIDTGNVGTGHTLYGTSAADSRVAVTLTVAGSDASQGPWTATSAGPIPRQLANPAVTAKGSELRMTTTVSLQGPPDAASLVATAFPAPGPVPVAVSARFAGEVGARPGSRLDLTVGLTPPYRSVWPTCSPPCRPPRAPPPCWPTSTPSPEPWPCAATSTRPWTPGGSATPPPTPPAPPRARPRPPGSPADRSGRACRPCSGCSSRPRSC
ncbi:hypothetical protein [Nonomuraea salmonea]|uniref:hypothetical protein n=1 Tax=Nonomuraea salmonea TaxID=46181 RepID=UPI0031ED6E73